MSSTPAGRPGVNDAVQSSHIPDPGRSGESVAVSLTVESSSAGGPHPGGGLPVKTQDGGGLSGREVVTHNHLESWSGGREHRDTIVKQTG